MAVKLFVLDTNVLLHDPQALTVFADNDVAITLAVLEELDKFKRNQDELGRNARRVIRNLDRLRTSGSLRDGVPLSGLPGGATGKLFIPCSLEDDYSQMLSSMENAGWSSDYADNRILCTARKLGESRQVIFVSKDINLRLKAAAMGLKVMDFERNKVPEADHYTGWRSVDLSRQDLELAGRGGMPDPLKDLAPNEFAVSESGDGRTALFRRAPEGVLKSIRYPAESRVWNITPRNREQAMALELLTNPDIQLVTMTGGAGTGKTLLAIAAGLSGVLRDGRYERILVSRPIIPLGNDLGYLPGAKNDKLASWMQPIFDNLEVLLAENGARETGRKSGGRITAETLINSKKLELEAITYIRGRSIPRQFVVIDEAQNLTPHEVKTIISRAGEGTKIILTGDPAQIDNPYLDTAGNGLIYCVEKFRSSGIAGHITLTSSERSPLAALAAKLL